MKSSIKLSLLLFLCFGFCSCLLISEYIHLNTTNFYEDQKDTVTENTKILNPHPSGELPIFINGSASAYNWIWAVSQPWCSGAGTKENPYVIENITINAQGQSSCIEIVDSNQFFTIRNCTLNNASTSYYNYGIKLQNANNSQIIENNCSNNSYGIRMDNCADYTIINNTMINNINYALRIYECQNITVQNNLIDKSYYGIYSWDTTHITFYNNTIIKGRYGIYLSGCENNNITYNKINNNTFGIRIYDSNTCNISQNQMFKNNNQGAYIGDSNNIYLESNNFTRCGIHLNGGKQDLFSTNITNSNRVNNKTLYFYKNQLNLKDSNFTDAGQILLVNCNNSLIKNANLTEATIGIALSYCYNTSISNCNVSLNQEYGIHLYYCENNTISETQANNIESDGIYLSNSNNNTIRNNTLTNLDDYGIVLSDSSNIGIISNNITNCGEDGINIWFSNTIEIPEGIIKNCDDDGISLYYSDDYVIRDETIEDCKDDGIYLSDCDDCIIRDGIIKDCGDNGIHLSDCDNVSINTETISFCNDTGIYLDGSDGNLIQYCTIEDNDEGISLSSSDYNTVTHNVLNRNKICITDSYCEGNEYSDNGNCEIIYKTYSGDDDDEDNGEVIEETSMFINPFALGIIIIVVLGVIGGIIAFIFILNRKPSQRPIAWVPSYPIPPPPPPQPIHPVKFCQICGKRLLGNEKFCQNCGKPTN